MRGGKKFSESRITGKRLFFIPANSDFTQPRLKLVDDNLAPDVGEFIDFRDAGISEPTFSSETSSPATSDSTSVSTPPLDVDCIDGAIEALQELKLQSGITEIRKAFIEQLITKLEIDRTTANFVRNSFPSTSASATNQVNNITENMYFYLFNYKE